MDDKKDNHFLEIDPESASIQVHLNIIQNVIQRMSNNSASCKAWCVTMVAAILVIVADKDKPSFAWIALLPTLVFGVLDIYYLAMEKAFRNSYNKFIGKIHRKKLREEDLYSITPVGSISLLQIESARSFSIWGFYAFLAVLVGTTRWIALG